MIGRRRFRDEGKKFLDHSEKHLLKMKIYKNDTIFFAVAPSERAIKHRPGKCGVI